MGLESTSVCAGGNTWGSEARCRGFMAAHLADPFMADISQIWVYGPNEFQEVNERHSATGAYCYICGFLLMNVGIYCSFCNHKNIAYIQSLALLQYIVWVK